jgi:hypothetical protein
LIYPDGRTNLYYYGSTRSLNDTISRLTGLYNGGSSMEQYSYLGLGTVVRRGQATGIDLRYYRATGESVGEAGDPYTGLDRFGRVVDQRWRKVSDGSHTSRLRPRRSSKG